MCPVYGTCLFVIIWVKIRRVNCRRVKVMKKNKKKRTSSVGYLGATAAVGICYFPLGVIFKLAKGR